MDKSSLVKAFRALSDPTRLDIFECLLMCQEVNVDENGGIVCNEGPTIGEICCQLQNHDKVTSTFSFHIKELREAGLILTKKNGKFVHCQLNPTAVQSMAQFLENGSSIDCNCDLTVTSPHPIVV